jgi:hypothetical protein
MIIPITGAIPENKEYNRTWMGVLDGDGAATCGSFEMETRTMAIIPLMIATQINI